MKPKESGGQMLTTDVALGYMESFSSGNPDTVASHVTEDFSNNQMGVLGNCFKGRSLYRERLVGFLTKFQQINYTPEQIISEGSKVAIAYRMRTVVDGCSIEIPGVMVIKVAGELVSQRDDYWDGLSYIAQTGIGLS